MLLEQNQIEKLIILVKEAGEQARRYYDFSDINVQYKSDKSPVTIADQELSDLITVQLTKMFPQIPIISEEADQEHNMDILKENDTYWLIDPIDGTKSFIRKKGDFTINIALIENKTSKFGIIYQPLKQALYYTGTDKKAYKEHSGITTQIKVNRDIKNDKAINIVVPTRHLGEDALNFIASLNVISSDQVSSSFKFCLVAEGIYDMYSNFSRINTWDIAAGHAILTCAGGLIFDRKGNILTYNKNSLRCPNFVAFSSHIGEEYIREKLAELL
ncbi:3'(2'),5'-bisphosphate nucleotidase CysQ [Holosporaceae bacterium 'Namur']|nr:3'(2'),5'-bisphosphate nucleotidase CysQ [Holosporaceae bacterium 'Namur']